MFRKRVMSISEVLGKTLREDGLETPLMHHRLIDAWGSVVGKTVEKYTGEKFIRNQTLFVKITNAALRADLSMMRSQLVKRMNESVGTMLITDIRIY